VEARLASRRPGPRPSSAPRHRKPSAPSPLCHFFQPACEPDIERPLEKASPFSRETPGRDGGVGRGAQSFFFEDFFFVFLRGGRRARNFETRTHSLRTHSPPSNPPPRFAGQTGRAGQQIGDGVPAIDAEMFSNPSRCPRFSPRRRSLHKKKHVARAPERERESEVDSEGESRRTARRARQKKPRARAETQTPPPPLRPPIPLPGAKNADGEKEKKC
jgi:hypothetical protein